LSWVDFDFESAVAALYAYLVSIGHRHVGFVGLPRRLHETGVGAAVRLQRAHDEAVVRHGLDPAAVPA
jgi:DNA-binding LacI/PurR family transcriptional regulator